MRCTKIIRRVSGCAIARMILLAGAMIMIGVVSSAEVPVGARKWRTGVDTFRAQIGGAIANYQRPDSTWSAIVNDFVPEGDSVAVCSSAALGTRVNDEGVVRVTHTLDGVEYTITQKLIGVGWINIDTRQSHWIDSTMSWSAPDIDSNIVAWSSVSPGVNYRIRKQNGRVEHGIFYSAAFLDSAVALYDQRDDSAYIALANVMIYTLSANLDHPDSAFGDVDRRVLKQVGWNRFSIRSHVLHYPGSEETDAVPVRLYWEKRGNSLVCVEYVMMHDIKVVHQAYPTATIWHNATETLDLNDIEDTWLNSGAPNNNYGGEDYNHCDGLNSHPYLIKFNTSDITPPVTVSACSLYVRIGSGTNTWNVRRVTTAWTEGTKTGSEIEEFESGATYNESNDSYAFHVYWGDGGDWGSSDYVGSNSDSRSQTGPGFVYHEGSTLAGDMEGFINGTYSVKSWAMYSNSSTQVVNSTESASKEPYVVIVYTASSTADFRRRRTIIQQ